MTASERYALGKTLEALERPKAQERMGTRTDLQPSGELTGRLHKGEVRDVVGEAIGFKGGRTWHELRLVGDRAKTGDGPTCRYHYP